MDVSQIPSPFYRVAVKAFITDEQGRFLLQKETRGVWDLPGGGLEFGEKPLTALKRELQEETGLTALEIDSTPSHFITVHLTRIDAWGANVLYPTKLRDITRFTPSNECVELRYFSKEKALADDTVLSNVKEFARIYTTNEAPNRVGDYIKEFDTWNARKKKVDALTYDENLFFNQREVWWASLGVNVGVEADGKHKDFERPVLIIKIFNDHMAWVIPLTSKEKTDKHHVKIRHEKGYSWANVPQMRIVSTKRLLRKIGMIPETKFTTILQKTADYLRIDPRKSGGLGGRSH